MGLALDVIQFSGTLWLLFGESEENHTRCTHWQSSEIGMGFALVIACGTEHRAVDRGDGSASNGSARGSERLGVYRGRCEARDSGSI